MRERFSRKMLPLRTQCFRFIVEKDLAKVERMLERIKVDLKKTDWNKGYLTALNGMASALRSENNQCVLILKMSAENLNDLKKTFLKNSKDQLFTDFDRGFFSAWVDYLDFVENFNALKNSMKLEETEYAKESK
jgi:hypothetical protein